MGGKTYSVIRMADALRNTHSGLRHHFFVFGFFLLLSLISLLPLTLCPNCLIYPPGRGFTDLLITHLPNAEYWRESLARYGQWPLWNAQLFAGQPFAADPLAGVWYPPNWLLLALPLPFAFNLLFLLHLAWAGQGLFLFLRGEGLRFGPAFFGALAFASTPRLIAHLGAGHVSLVCAVAWTPWLLIAVRQARSIGGLSPGAFAGVVLALIFLADVRWSFYATILGAAYWLAGLPPFASPPTPSPERASASARSGEGAPSRAGVRSASAFAVLFLSLSAVLLLPLYVFIRSSTRTALTLEEASVFSLPPYYLLGLLIPDVRGFHEYMTYLGVAPLLLLPLGLRRRPWFWIIAIALAVAFALGANFVLFPLLYRFVPGLSLLRVPARAWLIVTLGVSILAARGLQWLLDDGLPRLTSSPALPRLSRYVPSARTLLVSLLVFTVFDLWRVNITLYEVAPRPALTPAAQWIKSQPGQFRVYSPSYSLPLDDGLEHVDGVNPLRLAAADGFILAAGGVSSSGYRVTLPPLEADDLAEANKDALPDARLLGLLNVKYVAAEYPLEVAELKLIQTLGRTRLYENIAFQPRAWMDSGRAAEVVAWSPNRISVRADGPGWLTLSEVNYPGWQVSVDNVAAQLEAGEALLRRVHLDAGTHMLAFEFWPASVFQGLVITLCGLAALIGIWRLRSAPVGWAR